MFDCRKDCGGNETVRTNDYSSRSLIPTFSTLDDLGFCDRGRRGIYRERVALRGCGYRYPTGKSGRHGGLPLQNLCNSCEVLTARRATEGGSRNEA